jgi:hypothetical protein
MEPPKLSAGNSRNKRGRPRRDEDGAREAVKVSAATKLERISMGRSRNEGH